MRLLLTICLALLVQETEIERAVRLLASDDPAIRDTARTELLRMGPKARLALMRGAESADAEVRSRAREILSDLSRRERLEIVRREPKRITVRLENVRSEDAVQQVLGRFDAKVDLQRPEELPRRRISLSLKDADWWESFDAVTQAAGVEPREAPSLRSDPAMYGWALVLLRAEGRLASCRWTTVGSLRVYAQPVLSRADDKVGIEAVVAFPPGVPPVPTQVDEVHLEDDSGNPLPFKQGAHFDTGRGHIGYVTYGDALRTQDSLDRATLKGAKSLNLKGKLRVAYPRDIEIVRKDMKDLITETELSSGSMKVKIHLKADRNGMHMAEVSWNHQAQDQALIRAWLEDDRGEFVEDLPWDPEISRLPSGSISGNVRPSTARPLKAVAARLVGIEPRVMPFEIRGIPVPPPGEK